MCDDDNDHEIDKLVIWNWWTLGPNERNIVKEDFWLRNMGYRL